MTKNAVVAAGKTRGTALKLSRISDKAREEMEWMESVRTKMNSELLKIYETCAKRLDQAGQQNIQHYWDLGQEIEAVFQDPERFGGNISIEGQNFSPINLLASAFGSSFSVIYKARQLFAAYPSKAALKVLLDARQKNGRAMTWGQVQSLLKIEDPQKRLITMNECLERNLPARAIDDVLRSNQGERGKGGRPLRLPGDARQAVGEMIRYAKQLSRRMETWTGDSFDINTAVTAEDVKSPRFVERMQEAINSQIAVAKKAREVAEAMTARLQSLTGVTPAILEDQSLEAGDTAASDEEE